jgi:hypothetical protein
MPGRASHGRRARSSPTSFRTDWGLSCQTQLLSGLVERMAPVHREVSDLERVDLGRLPKADLGRCDLGRLPEGLHRYPLPTSALETSSMTSGAGMTRDLHHRP